MTANAIAIILLGVCCCGGGCGGADVPGGGEPEPAYDWDVVGEAARSRLRIWDGAMFMAVPRSERAAPATLLRYNQSEPAPRPFPTAGMQTESNCYGLQNARDIEIDHLGRLWTLDAAGATACDPKLFVADARTGAAIRSAVVPGHLYASRTALAGLALHLGTLTAVVADLGPADPGFIVYGWQTGVFRKFPCDKLRPQPGTTGGGGGGGVDDGGDGGDYDVQLVASPIDGLLYFTANRLASVFAIPWTVFDVAGGSVDRGHPVGHYVIDLGPKEDHETAAMIVDTAGTMYLGAGHAVMSWNTLSDGLAGARPFASDDRLARIAGLALDPNGYLWIASASSDGAAAAASRVKIFKVYCGETSFALLNGVAGDAAVNYTGHDATRRPSNAVAATGRPGADADYDSAANAADAIGPVAVGAGLAAFVAARST